MSTENQISEITRRAIIDNIVLGRISWAGRLTEGEFLSRMYDLTAMPSTDHRYRNAARDIWQHRDTWHDWDDGWVFYDARFNILHESDDNFLRFLCEMVHPVVRSDEEEARSIVRMLNEHLRRDGWELFEKEEISGHPVFSAKETATRSEIFSEPTGWMKVDRQLQEVRLRLETGSTEEQFQAVGLLCREVLITLGQMIHDPEKHGAENGIKISATDAKRMLEVFFSH